MAVALGDVPPIITSYTFPIPHTQVKSAQHSDKDVIIIKPHEEYGVPVELPKTVILKVVPPPSPLKVYGVPKVEEPAPAKPVITTYKYALPEKPVEVYGVPEIPKEVYGPPKPYKLPKVAPMKPPSVYGPPQVESKPKPVVTTYKFVPKEQPKPYPAPTKPPTVYGPPKAEPKPEPVVTTYKFYPLPVPKPAPKPYPAKVEKPAVVYGVPVQEKPYAPKKVVEVKPPKPVITTYSYKLPEPPKEPKPYPPPAPKPQPAPPSKPYPPPAPKIKLPPPKHHSIYGVPEQ